MRVAISGATGFIGSHLEGYLRARGCETVAISRSAFAGKLERITRLIDGCDVVVNLAGAPVNRRWSAGYKREIYRSRIDATRLLVEAIAAAEHKPAVMVSASAVGYYPRQGNYGDMPGKAQVLGAGYLSGVCAAWELEAQRVPPAVRLVIGRFGVVLSPQGGAFPALSAPCRMGVALQMGDGSRAFSWIALEDLVRAIWFVIRHKEIAGVVNMVSPQRLSYGELAAKMAAHYGTRFRVRVPVWALRLRYGEGVSVLFEAPYARPDRLMQHHFHYQSSSVERFLRRNDPQG